MEIASFVKVIAQSCIAEQKVGTPRYVMLPTSSEKAAIKGGMSRSCGINDYDDLRRDARAWSGVR